MKKLCLLAVYFAMFAGFAWAGEEYPLTPDSERQPGVPQGTVTKYTWISKIFPGTVRDYWVYVPAQYQPDKPACVMLFEDGTSYVKESGRARIPIVFDNLIAKHDMPVTIAILVDPGVLKGLGTGKVDRLNRSYEYDGLSDRYARFLIYEILPEVAKHYNLSTNPDDRAISGGSSGGICSFTVAWTHPEAFHRVLSFIGSFADLRGGDIYPALIRKTEPRPIRVFLQDGNHDLNNFAADWWLSNQAMASALNYAGYDFKFVTGDKDHDMIQGGAILPDALRWLWRDYPQPIPKPGMHHLGDRQTGYVDVGMDWELESREGKAAAKPSEEATRTYSILYGSGWGQVVGIAADPQGNVFFHDPSVKAIIRIDPDGRVSTFAENTAGAGGLAFGSDGLLYSCDGFHRIVTYGAGGNVAVRADNVACQDIVVSRLGGIYFTHPSQNQIGYIPPGGSKRVVYLEHQETFYEQTLVNPKGIQISPDQSLLYVTEPKGKWVYSFQIQPDGSLANGEPFFRMETPGDDSWATGATAMAVDRQGLLFVATFTGIQLCDQQGRVVGILNGPEHTKWFEGAVSGVAFGGADHQYLYAVVGNEVYRRHLVPKPPAP